MNKNIHGWNQTLKFSWGHIFAFMAIIFFSYVAYMGDFYANGGDFTKAGIKVFVTDIILLCVFIGAQVLKAADHKFDKHLIWERILVCLMPVVFVAGMLPYNHFWNVFAQREEIHDSFVSAIDNSKKIFSEYDSYAKDRIEAYDKHLQQIRDNYKTRKHAGGLADAVVDEFNAEVSQNAQAAYTAAGFTEQNDAIRHKNDVLTLSLQLQSANTDSLRVLAMQWIEDADQGASVWNAFLVGNVDMIDEAIESWDETLTKASEYKMTNEPKNVKDFQMSGKCYINASKELSKLKEIYTAKDSLSWAALGTAVVLFLMLLLPYLIQRRNEKARGYYSLFPHPNSGNEPQQPKPDKNKKKKPEKQEKTKEEEEDIIGADLFEDNKKQTENKKPTSNDTDDGDIFSGSF